MLRHVVLIKFNDSANEEMVQALAAKLDALPAAIPELVSLVHGRDAGVSSGKYSYGVFADFNSVADYQSYLRHPAHQAAGGAMMPLVADVAQLQLEY